MGARGPLPRSDRTTTATRHAPFVATEGGLQAQPRPPAGLLPEVRAAWDAYWGDSALCKVVGPADVDLVLRWIRYRNLLARSLRSLEQGDDGASVIDCQRLEKLVLSLEGALGVGPVARARLGVPSGSKSSADKLREAF